MPSIEVVLTWRGKPPFFSRANSASTGLRFGLQDAFVINEALTASLRRSALAEQR